MTAEGTGLSRRTVMRGAAWSVPVISLAAVAPAYAASGDGDLLLDSSTYDPASGQGSFVLQLDPAPGPGLDTGYFVFSDPDFAVQNASYAVNTGDSIVSVDYDYANPPGPDSFTITVNIPGYTMLIINEPAVTGTLTLTQSSYSSDNGIGQIRANLTPSPGPALDESYVTFADPGTRMSPEGYFEYLDSPTNSQINLVYYAAALPRPTTVDATITIPGYAPLHVTQIDP
ncbi:MAG: hypothetical protein JWR90_1244 [Marmoricola sp.]|jgi:hypothetical protein|nr:hypothetical protein [Marmoricola sp.]